MHLVRSTIWSPMAAMLSIRHKFSRSLLLISAIVALIATGCSAEALVEATEPGPAVETVETERDEATEPVERVEPANVEELLEELDFEGLEELLEGFQDLDIEGLEGLFESFDFEQLQQQLQELLGDLDQQDLNLDELLEGFGGQQLDLEGLDLEGLEGLDLNELFEGFDLGQLEEQFDALLEDLDEASGN